MIFHSSQEFFHSKYYCLLRYKAWRSLFCSMAKEANDFKSEMNHSSAIHSFWLRHFFVLLPNLILEACCRTPDLNSLLCQLLDCVLTLCNPWTEACQAPLAVEFSRQESWSGQPFPSPGNLPDPGVEPESPTLQAYSLLCESLGKVQLMVWHYLIIT